MRTLYLLLFLIGSSLCISCEKDVLGCTDSDSPNFNPDATVDDGTCLDLRDQLIDTWTIEGLAFNGNDGVALGVFSDMRMQFRDDDRFAYVGVVVSTEQNFGGQGTWKIDGDFLETTFTAGSSFCEDVTHRFTVDFDGPDNEEATLEDTCGNGTSLRIKLMRE